MCLLCLLFWHSDCSQEVVQFADGMATDLVESGLLSELRSIAASARTAIQWLPSWAKKFIVQDVVEAAVRTGGVGHCFKLTMETIVRQIAYLPMPICQSTD